MINITVSADNTRPQCFTEFWRACREIRETASPAGTQFKVSVNLDGKNYEIEKFITRKMGQSLHPRFIQKELLKIGADHNKLGFDDLQMAFLCVKRTK